MGKMRIKIFISLCTLLLLSLACGAQARADCPQGMVKVPGGWFQMGRADGEPDQRPVRRVWVDDFCLDKYEVSNREFADFLNNTAIKPKDKKLLIQQTLIADYGLEYVQGGFHPKKGMEKLPMVYVHFRQVLHYCAWKDKGPPTEAQWERACKLGSRGRPLKVSRIWGDEKANIHRWWRPHPDPVDSAPPDALGLVHMRGNVAEYVDDIYKADWYGKMPPKNPNQQTENPRLKMHHLDKPLWMERRSVRGGAFSLTPSHADCASRSFRNFSQADMNNFTGIRCACKVGKRQ